MSGFFTLLRRLGRDGSGAIAAIFAVLVPVLVATVGLGVETGIWYSVKRHNQSIADVAAYSGALELAGGGSCADGTGAAAKSSCPAAAGDANTFNGFDFADPLNTDSSVSVTTPGGITTVTVTLKHKETPKIVSYLGGTSPFTIFDQAVAEVEKINACISGLGKTGISFLIKGSAPTVSLPGCTITSDSTSADSIDTKGAAAIDAYSIITAGGVDGSCTNVTGLSVPPTCGATPPPVDPYAGVNPPTMLAIPSSVTAFPGLATPPSTPAAQNVNASVAAPTSTVVPPPPVCGTTTFVNTTFCYANLTPITISNTTLTAGKTYSFTGPGSVTIGAGVIIGDNAKISLNSATPANVTITGGVTFSPVSNKNNPTTIFVLNGSITSSGTVTFTGGGANGAYYALKASGGVTLGGNTVFGPADYGFFGGTLALNGCTVFKSGATTLQVPNGNLTTGSGGVYFNPNGTACGTAYTSAASTYALRVQAGGSYTIGGASADIASFGPANYGLTNGSVTVNGAATFNATAALPANVDIATGNLVTAAGSSLNFAGGSGGNYAFAVKNGGAYTIGGTAIFGTGSPTAPNYAFYKGGLTINAGHNAVFGPAKYYVDAGSLAVNGCAAFQAGTSTINLKAGSLTSAAGSTVAFNPPSGTTCGASQTQGASTYYISTGGGNVQLGPTVACASSCGTATFGAAIANNTTNSYYFYAGNVTLSGTTATLGAGIYSLQTGSFNIGLAATGSLTTATVASDTTTTYISEPNGNFSNIGKTTFGAGTIYFNDGSGGFTSSGTTAGALTFTGGNDSGGNPSNYYFYNPTGGGNTALDIAANANAAFGPATYYIVNGDLVINGGATLTCPGCAIGGAGDTFVLTGTGSGATLTKNIGTVQIPPQPPSAITTTLNAPGTGPYAGLLFFQNRNATAGSTNNGGQNCNGSCNYLDGGSTMDMTGAIYLPQGVLYFQGGNSSGKCLVIFDLETIFQGNSSLISDGCTAAGVNTIFTNHVALTQ